VTAHPHEHGPAATHGSPGHAHPHEHGPAATHGSPGHAHPHEHGHSHDHAQFLDDIAATTAAGIRATVIGLMGLLATALVQLALVAVTGSVALLSDTVHNLGDCLTAVPIWVAFHLARRPPSRRFTYGLGRFEDVAGLAVVAAIGASGVYAAWVSVDRLLHPAPTQRPWIVVGAGLVGVVGNEVVARYRIRAGRRIGSLALVADGEHARADGLSSLAVVASGLATVVGWSWADPIVGLVIAALITRLFFHTAGPLLGRLLDAVDPELVDRVEAAAAATPGVLAVADVRVRWLGHRARAEVTVTLDPALALGATHTLTHAVETAVRRAAPEVKAVQVHPRPASTGGPVA
jgi:cation diffusion facilitator family transporter